MRAWVGRSTASSLAIVRASGQGKLKSEAKALSWDASREGATRSCKVTLELCPTLSAARESVLVAILASRGLSISLCNLDDHLLHGLLTSDHRRASLRFFLSLLPTLAPSPSPCHDHDHPQVRLPPHRCVESRVARSMRSLTRHRNSSLPGPHLFRFCKAP